MKNVFIGIDVSKGYVDIATLDENGQKILNPFRLDDTAKGHSTFQEYLEDLYSDLSVSQMYAGVESTGGFEDNWLRSLQSFSSTLPVKSARLNPAGVKQYVKANGSRNITDEISAISIAEYMKAHKDKILFDRKVGMLEHIRPAWAALSLLKKQHGQLVNQLHSLLYRSLPSAEIYCRRGIPPWLQSILEKYPTAEKLSRAHVSSLCKFPYVTEKKARRLIQGAKNDLRLDPDMAVCITLSVLLGQLTELTKSISKLEKQLKKIGSKDERVKLICSFKGIGEISAIGLLLNMPAFETMKDASSLACYWGLHPVLRESGDGQRLPRMSKAGRVQPRAILFMCALSAVTCNPLIRKLYKRLVYKKGMAKMAALGVCMHKICRIVYGMLRTNTNFDPIIDKNNQKKRIVEDPKEAKRALEKRKCRYQSPDPDAPISKREKKRREKVNGSQNAVSVEYGLSADPSFQKYKVLIKE